MSSTAPPMSICACGRRGRGESRTARLRGATRSASREHTVKSPMMCTLERRQACPHKGVSCDSIAVGVSKCIQVSMPHPPGRQWACFQRPP
eukprot:scaffold5285_cov137-Isochrysis_galbana.AAC.5